MRPSSSSSEASFPGGLFGAVLERGRVRDEVSDEAWLRAMLDVESAIARAEARAGIVSDEAAGAIEAACRDGSFDLDVIGAEAAAVGNPVEPLVRALAASLPEPAARVVHRGATSQDVLDSAAMLVGRRSIEAILADVDAVTDALAELAERHRGAVMAGRTLLQQAAPITFGAKVAGWLVGLDEAAVRLEEVSATRLAVQLGGAVGTLASLQGRGTEVLRLLAEDLGLAEPTVPWHASRVRIVELAGALAGIASAVSKAAGDVVLLTQTEVGEAREVGPGRGGSSTLPNKRNAIGAVCAAACGERAVSLAAGLVSAGPHEHERAAGAWHAEWRTLSDLLLAVGSAASWIRDCMDHLEVDPERMRANLELGGGLVFAEQVATALADEIGRPEANELVARAAASVSGGGRFADALRSLPEVAGRLAPDQIERLLDPAAHLGSADAFVDRALEAHRARMGPR